ncbi:MAG TPA: molybdopterin dinucleotide binding domain-containing protein [Candidatus Deferrimicrobiaceae bacterium]
MPDLAAAGKIPDPEMLLIAQVNPVFAAANQKSWKEWLSRIPLVVQCSTMIDDTSPYADIVLPLTTFLEQWDLTLPVPNLPFAQAGLQQPIAPPLSGTRPLGDILLQLGREAGRDRFPENDGTSYAEQVQGRMKEIFASGKGTPYFEAVSLEFLEDLRKRGWQVYSYPAFADFWRLLREKGGWWDPEEYPAVDWSRKRKFLFPTAPRLAALLKESSVPGSGGNGDQTAKAPHLWIEGKVRKPDGMDSFLLVPFTTLMNMTGEGASQPLLQEMLGLYPRLYWNSWAEMHPERAARLELEDGELIQVHSGKVAWTLPVRIVPSVSPEILCIPFGQGHTESGRTAKNIGVNPMEGLEHRSDPLSGRNSWQSTLVRVKKIRG